MHSSKPSTGITVWRYPRTTALSPSAGFTLIELLVVVAIIAVIAALLLPAIASARHYANRAKCQSGQRQLGIAMRAYAEDFEGRVPLTYAGSTKQANYYFATSSGGRGAFGNIYWSGLAESPRLYFCPSYRSDHHQFATPNNPWPPKQGTGNTRAGFQVRPVVAFNFNNGVFSAPLPALDDYGHRAVASCLTHNRTNVPGGHRTGVNVLYGDGHVAWVRYVVFERFLAPVPSGSHSTGYNIWIDQVWAAFDGENL